MNRQTVLDLTAALLVLSKRGWLHDIAGDALVSPAGDFRLHLPDFTSAQNRLPDGAAMGAGGDTD